MWNEEKLLMEAATFGGEHALSGFFVLLGVLLILVAAAWRLAQRYAVPSETSRLPPSAFLILHLLFGFVLIVGAAAVFAEIADEIGGDEELGALDQAFTAALSASISPRTVQFFALATHAGDPITLTLVCSMIAAYLMWGRRWWLAAACVLTIAGNAVLNVTLKYVFQRARPIHDAAWAIAEGWSFPSGHTSGSVVTYGILAYVLLRQLPGRWHLLTVVTATTLAFTTGCSRVFIQVHFASDVAAGFASGTAWLAVCLGSIELTRYYRRTRVG